MLPANWEIPSIQTIKEISQLLKQSVYKDSPLGCDISPVNLFLYRYKYNTQICYADGILYRRFKEKDFIYYGFPIALNPNQNLDSALKSALNFVKQDAQFLGIKANTFFATEELLNPLQNPCSLITCIESLGIPGSGIQSVKDRDLADYVYLQKNLSELAGAKYSKKRGHINQFLKKHEDSTFVPLTNENTDLALQVEKQWLKELETQTGTTAPEDLLVEQELITKALTNFDELDLSGGLIMCNNQPVAMCIASTIGNATTDVHFEKAIEPYAHHGAYAFINREFAKICTTRYINREEDLGFENLRKAKLSYYPDLLIEKSILILI